MSDAIPLETQELIRQFKEEEAKKAAGRAFVKKPPLKRETQQIPRQLTAKEAEHLALRFSCHIESGNGRHGKHIVAPDGESVPLPDHGGGKSLSTGVRENIKGFFKVHGIRK